MHFFIQVKNYFIHFVQFLNFFILSAYAIL